MGKVAGFCIERVMEAHGFRQFADRRFFTSQKMPAVFSARSAVASNVILLLSCGKCGRIAWIDAHRKHLKFIADVKADCPQGSNDTIQQERTKIAAVVVDEVED